MNFEKSLAMYHNLFWICILVPVIFSFIGVFLARKIIGRFHTNQHQEIAKTALGPVSTVFAILAAFIVATSWTEYSRTIIHVNQESEALNNFYVNAEAFHPVFCKKAKELCLLYRDTVLADEWKMIQKGNDILPADSILREISRLCASYQIDGTKESDYFQLIIAQLSIIRGLRQQRLDDSSSGLPRILWALFLLGGVILITINFLMVTAPSITHISMVLLIAIMIGMMCYAIIRLQFPFTGSTKISSQPFELILKEYPPLRSFSKTQKKLD